MATGRAFRGLWSLREIAGVEGAVYAAIFKPSLVPVLLLSALVMAFYARRDTDSTVPASSGAALRVRLGEIIGPLLLSCVAAALVKVFAPGIPDVLILQTLMALGVSTLTTARSGTHSIPAVAVAVHFGGIIPATAWILGSTARCLLDRSRHPVTKGVTTAI